MFARRLAALALLLAPLAVRADETPEPDRALIKAFKKLDLKYKIDEDNDFVLVFDTTEGRSQAVIVRSLIGEYGSLRTREVMAAAWQGEELAPEVARAMLRDNTGRIIGAWQLQGQSPSTLVYVARVPAKLKPEQLLDAIIAVALSADDAEEKLTQGADQF